MNTRFLNHGIWSHITRLARKNSRKSHVAVAYFGPAGHELLPLGKGSTLVLDMSEKAVLESQTCPTAIGKLLDRGVTVYSCPRLHAKVFVLGRWAIVGSTNASLSSNRRLIEAGIETSEPTTVKACRVFIKSHSLKRVTRREIQRLAPLYHPPANGVGGGKGRLAQNLGTATWAVSLVREDWESADKKAADKARPKAEKELTNKRKFKLEEFLWTDHALLVGRGDEIVQVLTEPDRRVLVYPPAKVLRVVQYFLEDSPRMVVFLKAPRKARCRSLRSLVKRIGEPARILKKLRVKRQLKNLTLIGALREVWPSLEGA